MFTKESVCPVNAGALTRSLLLVLLLVAPAAAQPPTNCEDALDESGGSTVLVHDQTLATEKKVDEWDNDIVKITAPRSGLLEIGAVGVTAQSALFTGVPSSSTFELVDGAPVGTNQRLATVIVEGEVYCIEIDPPPGVTEGDLTVEVTFIDPCKVGDPDDHGDTFGCATEIDPLSSTTSAAITTTDFDVFTFELSSTQTVELKSTGSTDVAAKLYRADGTLMASDSDSGEGSNFEITQSLNAGRYYLRVTSENSGSGNYSMVAF